ncbi:MAG: hypothetical protein HFJ33_04295 [Clostridia bacterium]|nr:hypothetical protein [Clostridia bacterium]
MKKIVKLVFVLLIAIFIMGNVYASLSCEVSVKASKTEMERNQEFTVDFNIAKIQSERGVISLGATLEYDKDSLELIKLEGKNGWETPTEGASFNESNGKIAITRSGLGNADETIFTATFKVKEASKQNLMITLKNITVADGTKPAKIQLAYQNITVKDGDSNPLPQPPDENTNTNPGQNTTNTNNGTNTNINTITNITTNSSGNKDNNKTTTTNTLNKNTMNNGSLPKAGEATAMVFLGLIVVAGVVAGFFFVKMKIINKEIDK